MKVVHAFPRRGNSENTRLTTVSSRASVSGPDIKVLRRPQLQNEGTKSCKVLDQVSSPHFGTVLSIQLWILSFGLV